MQFCSGVDNLSRADAVAAWLRALSLQRTGSASVDSSLLEQAVRTWQSYLANPTQDDGRSESKLGETLLMLAEIWSDSEPEQAQRAYAEAFDAFASAARKLDRVRLRPDWVDAHIALADAAIELGEEGADAERIDKAIEALEEALAAMADERTSERWVKIQDRLGSLLLVRGRRSGVEVDLERAKTVLEEAVEVGSKATSSLGAGVRRHLAEACRGLAEHLKKQGNQAEALPLFERAANEYAEAGRTYDAGLADADAVQSKTAARASFLEAARMYGKLKQDELEARTRELARLLEVQIDKLSSRR
jgi:tetratricopeptide (TPR) repeat protein